MNLKRSPEADLNLELQTEIKINCVYSVFVETSKVFQAKKIAA